MLDLPSHEVHLVDSHADLFRAFAIAAAGRLDLAAPPTLIKMDRRLYDLREQFEQEVGKLKAEAATIGARFGVENLHGRLDVLLRAWKEGVNRDQIRNAELQDADLRGFEEALLRTWSSGHPRAWLAASGAKVKTTSCEAPWLPLSRTEGILPRPDEECGNQRIVGRELWSPRSMD